jgi:hypothetical protein
MRDFDPSRYSISEMRTYGIPLKYARRVQWRNRLGRWRNWLIVFNWTVGAILAGLYASLGIWWLVRWIVAEN